MPKKLGALTLLILLTAPAIVQCQTSLPIIADSSFASSPAESVLGSQLSSWGVKLGPLDLALDLGCLTQPVKTSDLVDLQHSATKAGVGRAEVRGIGGLIEVEVDGGEGWGEADNVARGARGDTEWFTYMSIGSPPQSLPILPDTGSSDTFVFASDCSTCFLNNHSSFNFFVSSSFRRDTGDFRVRYADGSAAEGWVGSDIFTFGQGHTVSAPMPFGLATWCNGTNLRNSARSGVLGLGLEPMATITNGTTLFAALVEAGQIQDKVLSIRLMKGEQSRGVVTQEGTGSYVFGGIEDLYIRGGRFGLRWVPTTSVNYWGFTLDDISMGFESILTDDTTTPRRAVIDTGTSLIITSDTAAASVHRHIPGSVLDGSGVWYIPCSVSWPDVPNLFFTIRSVRYGVPITDLAWKASAVYPDLCISGVQGGMSHFTVLGDMFIKNQYVVLSYEKDVPQVGLGGRTDVPVVL